MGEGTSDAVGFSAGWDVKRKLLHRIGSDLGLITKSFGGGEERFVRVWKSDGFA